MEEVNITSYIVTIGDVVEVKEKTKKSTSIKHAIETVDAEAVFPMAGCKP